MKKNTNESVAFQDKYCDASIVKPVATNDKLIDLINEIKLTFRDPFAKSIRCILSLPSPFRKNKHCVRKQCTWETTE